MNRGVFHNYDSAVTGQLKGGTSLLSEECVWSTVGFENKPPGPDGFFECMWFGSNEVAFPVLPMELDPIQLYRKVEVVCCCKSDRRVDKVKRSRSTGYKTTTLPRLVR